MNKRSLFNEQGQLTEFGRAILGNYFDVNIALTLGTADNEAEARTIGACLSSYVAELISKKVQAFHEEAAKMGELWKMSDDEFKAYLTEKYKDVVAELINEGKPPFFSMNQKEVERYDSIAKKEMRKLRDEMDKEKEKMAQDIHHMIITRPGVRF